MNLGFQTKCGWFEFIPNLADLFLFGLAKTCLSIFALIIVGDFCVHIVNFCLLHGGDGATGSSVGKACDSC